MDAQSHMNYLALNQNIFNKPLVIGSGPQEGKAEDPISTFNGLKVYLNGTHAMPDHSELLNGMVIGRMIHPYAMNGMPSSSGELSYELWDSENEYIIIVRLKLDESSHGDSEPAADILALVKKDEIPESISQNEESYYTLSEDMLLCHFDLLFEFYEKLEDLNEWTFEDDALHTIIKHHFDLKNAVDSIGKSLE